MEHSSSSGLPARRLFGGTGGSRDQDTPDISSPLTAYRNIISSVGRTLVTNMTRRVLVILTKGFIGKHMGAYRANANNGILVIWNMSLLQRVISARRFRIGILDMVNASD